MKTKTRWLATALLCAIALVAAGCGEDSSTSPTTAAPAADDTTTTVTTTTVPQPTGPCSDEEVVCVGLVTDVGELDDRSFNQSAWEGVELARDELGVRIDNIETQTPKDYATNIELFVERDYDIIVTVGFAIGDATQKAAEEYPDVQFIGIDQDQGETVVPNVAGLIFPERRAGFLAGVLAGKLTKSKIIAAVVGTDLAPAVVRFTEGYAQGANYVDDSIKVLKSYHPGGFEKGFTDPEWGATTAKQVIDQKADVIFGAGGKTGNGALGEVAKHEGLYCIGVDTDQWETVLEARNCLVSSALKLITQGVRDLVGNFQAGNFVGEVGLADYHDFRDTIPNINEIDAEIKRVDQELRAGTLNPEDYSKD